MKLKIYHVLQPLGAKRGKKIKNKNKKPFETRQKSWRRANVYLLFPKVDASPDMMKSWAPGFQNKVFLAIFTK